MKGMIRQELKNYFKNPLYWVGILFILYGLFQILSPYLDVHYFHSKQEVQQTKPESLADADIMDGYVKSTEKERIDLAAKKIQSMIVKEFGEDAENVRKTLKEIGNQGSPYLRCPMRSGRSMDIRKVTVFSIITRCMSITKGQKMRSTKI